MTRNCEKHRKTDMSDFKILSDLSRHRGRGEGRMGFRGIWGVTQITDQHPVYAYMSDIGYIA